MPARRGRVSTKAVKQNGPTTILRVSPDVVAQGGIDLAQESLANKEQLSDLLRGLFCPVNIEYPGLRVLNIDPPVLLVNDFIPATVCSDLITAASDQKSLKQSEMQTGQQDTNYRTSSTLALTRDILTENSSIETNITEIHRRALDLILVGSSIVNPLLYCRPTKPGEFSFELPQLARAAFPQS